MCVVMCEILAIRGKPLLLPSHSQRELTGAPGEMKEGTLRVRGVHKCPTLREPGAQRQESGRSHLYQPKHGERW